MAEEQKSAETTEKPPAEKPAEKPVEKAEEKPAVKAEKKAERPRKAADDNVIFVGKKPTMSYVLAVMTQFDGNDEVLIKARGRSISRAVDVVEAVRNKFVKDVKHNVQIGTEEVQDSEGKRLNVSTIEISLKK